MPYSRFLKLSEITRKVRKSLLVFSLIGYAVSKIDISISKVSVVGTEFLIGNFDAIPFVLGMIILYFLLSFLTYSWAEFREVRIVRLREKLQQRYRAFQGIEFSRTVSEINIRRLKKEINNLKEKMNNQENGKIEYDGKIRKISEIIDEKEKRIDDYQWLIRKDEESTTYSLFPFSLKFLMEFFIPITIGIYACILVFFFTEFKIDQAQDTKTQMIIKADKIFIQNQPQAPKSLD
jgi:hypothetical protein